MLSVICWMLLLEEEFLGFSVSGVNISHLLFVDDTLLFCELGRGYIQYSRALFLSFEIILGLKVNLLKSEMIPWILSNIWSLASILGCKVTSLPINYLDLPFGVAFQVKIIWNGALEKTERRLAGWKRIYLSKEGRIILIKSTPPNLPTSFLFFSLICSLASRIEKVFHAFL